MEFAEALEKIKKKDPTLYKVSPPHRRLSAKALRRLTPTRAQLKSGPE